MAKGFFNVNVNDPLQPNIPHGVGYSRMIAKIIGRVDNGPAGAGDDKMRRIAAGIVANTDRDPTSQSLRDRPRRSGGDGTYSSRPVKCRRGPESDDVMFMAFVCWDADLSQWHVDFALPFEADARVAGASDEDLEELVDAVENDSDDDPGPLSATAGVCGSGMTPEQRAALEQKAKELYPDCEVRFAGDYKSSDLPADVAAQVQILESSMDASRSQGICYRCGAPYPGGPPQNFVSDYVAADGWVVIADMSNKPLALECPDCDRSDPGGDDAGDGVHFVPLR